MYAFCPTSCDPTGNETNSKWTEFNFGIYRASDVSIGANVFPDSKLYIDGNLTSTGNLQTNGFYFGNVALAEGLPTSQDSKWTQSNGNIFRDSLVSINNSVNTNHDFFVNGNANITLGVESPFLLTTGNVDTITLNVSGNVDASYFKGDAGGLSNVAGGSGSRWNETLDGKLFVNKNVGIKTSFPFSPLTINGNVIIENENQLSLLNDSQIIFNAVAPVFPPLPLPLPPITNASSNVIKMVGSSALQVGGETGNLISGNFINEHRIHTTLNSCFSHLGVADEENIKYAVLGVRGANDFDTIINTIDAPFQVLDAFITGRLTISTIKASQGGKDIPNGKKVNVMVQTCAQAGFSWANITQGLPLLTNNDEVVFTVQTGDYTGLFTKGMVNNPKQFMCLIWLNDF